MDTVDWLTNHQQLSQVPLNELYITGNSLLEVCGITAEQAEEEKDMGDLEVDYMFSTNGAKFAAISLLGLKNWFERRTTVSRQAERTLVARLKGGKNLEVAHLQFNTLH